MSDYMTYKIPWSWLIFLLVLNVAAQESCEVIVQAAIETASTNCAGLRRNQACYGNARIDAEAANGVNDFIFNTAGDIVNVSDIASMRLSSQVDETGEWGLALMQVQLNLPDSISENATLVLMGNTEVGNIADGKTLTIIANSNTRLRTSPTSANDLNIVEGISVGTSLEAFGRTEDGEWLRVLNSGVPAWVSALVVDGDTDRMNLPVVDVNAAYYYPMQAFTLRSSNTDCTDLPQSGLLVQTPEGIGSITLHVNEIRVELGSIIFLAETSQTVEIYVLEGNAFVGVGTQVQYVPAGSFTSVSLSQEQIPSSAPTFPEPFAQDVFEELITLLTPLFETEILESVPLTEPLSTDEIATAITQYYDGIGLVAGRYAITKIDGLVQGGTGNCPAEGGTFVNTHDGNAEVLFTDPQWGANVYGNYEKRGNGVFGADDAQLDSARNLSEDYLGTAGRITVLSPTQFILFEVSNGNGSSAYCEFTYFGTFIGE